MKHNEQIDQISAYASALETGSTPPIPSTDKLVAPALRLVHETNLSKDRAGALATLLVQYEVSPVPYVMDEALARPYGLLAGTRIVKPIGRDGDSSVRSGECWPIIPASDTLGWALLPNGKIYTCSQEADVLMLNPAAIRNALSDDPELRVMPMPESQSGLAKDAGGLAIAGTALYELLSEQRKVSQPAPVIPEYSYA